MASSYTLCTLLSLLALTAIPDTSAEPSINSTSQSLASTQASCSQCVVQNSTKMVVSSPSLLSSFTRNINPSLTIVNPSMTHTSMDSLQSETSQNISVATLTSSVMLIGSGATNTQPALESPTVTHLQIALTSSSPPIVTPSPSDKVDILSSSSLLIPVGAIIGLGVGGITFFLLILCCLFCCWRCCCYFPQKYEYRTGAEFKITAHYWTQGSASYRVTRRDSFSSRMSSLRSSLSAWSRGGGKQENETHGNQAIPEVYNTPL